MRLETTETTMIETAFLGKTPFRTGNIWGHIAGEEAPRCGVRLSK